jgi:thiol-disulfide isomerase/thioredoxin
MRYTVRRTGFRAALVGTVFFFTLWVAVRAQFQGVPPMNAVHAPDFPADFAWLNTDQPLSFKTNLKGQVVVMDFWCYCCINCMHVIPDLEYLEQKYKDQPVVILGVHSNKYDNESDPANIRTAIQRYNIHHPVIVDQGHRIWDAYAVNSWPTLVVVGADGHVLGGVSGEGHRDLLDKVIAKALADARADGTLASAPLHLAKEGQVRAASGLSFPGKVLADPTSRRLIIVDSNHNRIVVASYPDASAHASVEQIIGTGEVGQTDGAFDKATFNRPQGAALAGNMLYVADTENHLVRRVDLEKKTVTTILGTGKQVYDTMAGKAGRRQGLNSPWDVAVTNGRLYIAQAGQHQIFATNLNDGDTWVVAGTGRENIVDGPATNASLAQPSGLALDAGHQILYFADSEVSAVRGLDLKAGRVFTVIGHGLFTFGDVDGNAKSALLQHAIGLALMPEGKLLVADTYNHKLKLVDPTARTAKTLAGTGKAGTGSPGQPLQLYEPASVAVTSATEAFIADTDNHRIVRLNPQTGAWKEVVIDGLRPPEKDAAPAADPALKGAHDAGAVPLPADKPLMLTVTLNLPTGHHLTEGAPLSLRVADASHTLETTTLSAPEGESSRPRLTATLPAETLAAKPHEVYISVFYTHCSSGASAVCTPADVSWKLTPSFDATAPAELTLAP